MTTATRTIQTKTIRPGESTTISVSITGDTKSVALMEIPPEGWTITRGTDNAFAFKPSTNEWVWTGQLIENKVEYTLTAPIDIPAGTYHIEGNTMHADGNRKNVDGDNTIFIVI